MAKSAGRGGATLPAGRHSTESECSECGLVFCGVGPFDSHRVGRHGIDRRCLTEAEMVAKKFERCELGRWVKP